MLPTDHSPIFAEPDQRVAFLDEACNGDAALRQEVESLLSAQGRLGFLHKPQDYANTGRTNRYGRTLFKVIACRSFCPKPI
jgi:hypothetical protein